jgi:gliding motility-associated-like protein
LSREIVIYGSPRVDFSYAKACTGKKTIFTDASSPAMVPIKRWSWDFGDVHSTTDTSDHQNPQYVYKQAGDYPVILEITDENQCEDIIRKVITVNPTPISRFDIISNYEGIYGNVLMENLSQGAESYMWDFDNGETSELENPQVFYDENGTYIIQLVTKNEYDCLDTAWQQVEIVIQGLFVPNAFVPEDQNPELRTFKPVGINLRKYKIEIFNRWGSVIWSSMKLDDEGSPAEAWDGTYKGKPMPVGDYIWLIEAEFKNGHKWQGSDVGDGNNKTYGTVTLIR